MRVLLTIMSAMLAAMPAFATVPTPFFMFAGNVFKSNAEQAAVIATLERHTTVNDYLGWVLAQKSYTLFRSVDTTHLFRQPTSLAGVGNIAANGCTAYNPGLVVYNPETLATTPLAELQDLPTAIAEGTALLNNPGRFCQTLAVAPGSQFIGIYRSCAFNAYYEPPIGPNVVTDPVDWSGVSLIILQTQGLTTCAPEVRDHLLINEIYALSQLLRASAPDLKIVVEFSLALSSPADLTTAIAETSSYVDGYFIAYPQHLAKGCPYCTPQNLDTVLSAIRP